MSTRQRHPPRAKLESTAQTLKQGPHHITSMHTTGQQGAHGNRLRALTLHVGGLDAVTLDYYLHTGSSTLVYRLHEHPRNGRRAGCDFVTSVSLYFGGLQSSRFRCMFVATRRFSPCICNVCEHVCAMTGLIVGCTVSTDDAGTGHKGHDFVDAYNTAYMYQSSS